MTGAEIGAALVPVGAVAGVVVGAAAGAWAGWNIIGPMFNGKADEPVVYPDNPKGAKDRFKNISGMPGKQCDDGSVWEADRSSHGGDQWKRWPNKDSWERGDTPDSVWPDSHVRK